MASTPLHGLSFWNGEAAPRGSLRRLGMKDKFALFQGELVLSKPDAREEGKVCKQSMLGFAAQFCVNFI